MLEGIGVFATDTVYGIGCVASPKNPAYQEIFALKERPFDQKLPLLAPTTHAACALVREATPAMRALARVFWPGALTIVATASTALAPEYVARDGSIAVRVPNARPLVDLMAREHVILANTSANIHGAPDPSALTDVPARLLQKASWTLDEGRLPLSLPSTVVDIREGPQSVKIVRQGQIEGAAIEEVLRTCV